MDSPRGYLCLILHAHLPFVRHPEYDDALEERWLFHAMTESYIPILGALFTLAGSNVPFRLTVSLSPPLLEMLHDELLMRRYKRYLGRLIDLCDKEVERLRDTPQMVELAAMYKKRFQDTLRTFTRNLGEDLPKAWSRLRRMGVVELMTSAATHAYLPLLMHRESVGAQVRIGVDSFRRRLGIDPDGFWLPECAYSPEVEPLIKECGVKYFVLETHGVLCARPHPKFGYHAPIITPCGLHAFGRDPECSNQVWSADEGYPGDGAYREFHRDIAYDLPVDYLGAVLPGGHRAPTGIKYHRVTHRQSQDKAIYEPEKAILKAKADAGNFVFWRNKEAEHYGGVLRRAPLMVAPYDAELFGHWWYEGPVFLQETLRLLADPNQGVRSITPGEYLRRHPDAQNAEPAVSSWGRDGYSQVWLEGNNAWLYRHLHACQESMSAACAKHAGASGIFRRALNQALRELLLAQSSDWPFIITSSTMAEYAAKRLRLHMGRFQEIMAQLDDGEIDDDFLTELEARDSIFPDLQFESFREGLTLPETALTAGDSMP